MIFDRERIEVAIFNLMFGSETQEDVDLIDALDKHYEENVPLHTAIDDLVCVN